MKKYIYWDLFHLSLVLSLLRLYPNLYRGATWDAEPFVHDVFLGDSTAYTQARFHNLHNNRLNAFIHPKNIDDAIEHSLFIHDVNSLCRRPGWNFSPPRRETNIFAYIVNELQPHSVTSTAQENQESETSEPQSEVTAAELTQADMDLIEVLWKQDIDMGIAREVYDGTWKPREAPVKVEEEPSGSPSSSSYNNPWRGLNYSIDSETGEHIVLPTNDSSNNAAALVPNNYLDITLEEALSLFEVDNLNNTTKSNDTHRTEDFNDPKSGDVNLLTTNDFLLDNELPYVSSPDQDRTLLEQLQDLQEMVSEAQVEPYPESFSSVNSEYADMSSNFNSTENNHAILDALLQNTTLALPMNETLNASFPSPGDGFSMEHDTNINTLLSFLTNDTDPNPVGAVGGEDQLDLCPGLPIANLTVDNSFLNQLMNEGSMDFTDFCDLPMNTTSHNDWPASTSSDSAVSSMGSDWSDSCSGESSNGGSSAWNPTKFSFGFKSDGLPPLESERDKTHKPVQPSPKKYHSLSSGKKGDSMPQIPEKSPHVSFPASPDEEYEGPSETELTNDLPHLAFIHNHTYHFVGDAVPDKEASQKPLERDKPKASPAGTVRGTRDEKRLRNSNLPLTVKEIVDLPIERFNERLAQLNLADEHVSLIRDIRRRGKNKLAARTCRKRKVDQISELQGVLDELHYKRELAHAEWEDSITRRDLLKQKYQRLYRFIFPDHDPPEPVPSTAYFEEDSVVPPSRFPLCANAASRNETEHKKRGKHKGANDK